MKFILAVALLFCSFNKVFAQTYATTDEGKRVILKEDGTWEYEKGKEVASKEPDSIKVSTKQFVKPPASKILLKSKKTKFGLWYNDAVWEVTEKPFSASSECSLVSKSGDGFCFFITEKVELTYDLLLQAALNNAKNISENVNVVSKEYRMVNNKKILFCIFDVKKENMKFKFAGYYYTGEEGTVQFVTYTSNNIFSENLSKFEALLNGLVITE